MTAVDWSTLSRDVKARIRMAVLDVVGSAPAGQCADLEDVEPEHQTQALRELVDRGVVEHISSPGIPSAGFWYARPWRVGDVVAVWGGVYLHTSTVELVAKDGSCTVTGIPYRWRADGSSLERGGYHLRRVRS